jgi:NADH-quinone oxidoreductase subunit N
MFYLAVELQSLAFYALASFNKNSEFCVEAGMKYFILGALTSGFILFGFSLVYASFGTFSFESFDRFNSLVFCPSAICGVLFFSFAILFKLGAFPFNFWLCDVYDGSFLSLTAFFSIIPKVILLSLFIIFHFVILNSSLESFQYLFVLSGMSSICFAATAALYQKRLKRLLAYSAISHVGFLVVGVGCLSLDSIKACTIYITLYILMSLLIFGILFWSGFENKNQKFLVA